MRRPYRRSRWSARRSWSSWSGAAARLTGPLYAADDAGAAQQGGFGHSRSGRTVTVSIGVRHVRPGGAELEVRSSDEPSWGPDAYDEWRLVAEWTSRVTRPEVLGFPLLLRADRWERDVLVDGVAVPFTFVGGDETWSAVGRPGGREVTVSGTAWPHVGLELVTVDVRDVVAQVLDL